MDRQMVAGRFRLKGLIVRGNHRAEEVDVGAILSTSLSAPVGREEPEEDADASQVHQTWPTPALTPRATQSWVRAMEFLVTNG